MIKVLSPIMKPLMLCTLLIALAMVQKVQAADQPAARTVLNVFTYRADGSLIGNTYGFFIQDNGTAITSYRLFVGAARAEVIDAHGNKLAVHRILGASSTMDLVKFRVATDKPTAFLPLAKVAVREDAELLLVNYSTKKGELPTGTRITDAASFNGYAYYDITAANAERNYGCPLVNSAGEAVAIVQKNVGNNAKTACALDAKAAESLNITTTSALNSDLSRLEIPRAIPADEKDALAYIYMLNSSTAEVQRAALDDFIAAFPENAEGYVNRANYLGEQIGQHDAALADFATALEKADAPTSTMNADEVHYALSKLYFRWSTSPSGAEADSLFTLALREAQAAYEIKANPLYLQQQSEILIMSNRLEEALDKLDAFNKSTLATPESRYRQVQVLQAMNADSLVVLDAMNRVVDSMEKPYNHPQAHAYLLARAMQFVRCGMYRESVFDFNEYEKVVGPQRLSHQFYYLREQSERKSRMFQQALDDIRSAESRATGADYDFYRLEEVSILVQVQLYDEAITCGEELLQRQSGEGLLHRLLAVSYGEKGQKEKAREYLQRAIALGETGLDTLVEKYK